MKNSSCAASPRPDLRRTATLMGSSFRSVALLFAITSGCQGDTSTERLDRSLQAASIGQAEFAVALSQDGSYFCNGITLSQHWLLTTAECIHGFPFLRGFSSQTNDGSFTVSSGFRVEHANSNGNATVSYEGGANFIVHPDYYQSPSTANNVALIRVFGSGLRQFHSASILAGHYKSPQTQFQAVSFGGYHDGFYCQTRRLHGGPFGLSSDEREWIRADALSLAICGGDGGMPWFFYGHGDEFPLVFALFSDTGPLLPGDSACPSCAVDHTVHGVSIKHKIEWILEKTNNTLTPLNYTSHDVDGYHYIKFFEAIELRAKHSSKCIDVTNASEEDGANVQQWYCNNTLAQEFRLFSTSGGHLIVNRNSGKCLEVLDGSTANGANIHQAKCNQYADKQIFELEYNNDGTFSLRNQRSGKCVDVHNRLTGAGVNIKQWGCVDVPQQRFYIEEKTSRGNIAHVDLVLIGGAMTTMIHDVARSVVDDYLTEDGFTVLENVLLRQGTNHGASTNTQDQDVSDLETAIGTLPRFEDEGDRGLMIITKSLGGVLAWAWLWNTPMLSQYKRVAVVFVDPHGTYKDEEAEAFEDIRTTFNGAPGHNSLPYSNNWNDKELRIFNAWQRQETPLGNYMEDGDRVLFVEEICDGRVSHDGKLIGLISVDERTSIERHPVTKWMYRAAARWAAFGIEANGNSCPDDCTPNDGTECFHGLNSCFMLCDFRSVLWTCWCDEYCHAIGDCCEDKVDACGE